MSAAAPAQSLNDWTSADFWRDFGRGLRIEDKPFLTNLSIFQLDMDTGNGLAGLVRQEGYFQLPPQDWNLPAAEMVDLVTRLDRAGIPCPFAFVFDEFWALSAKLYNIVSAVLGPECLRLPDFWVWFVDPARADSGWKPHRDKGHLALRADRSPKALTVWVPLTDATTLNGCMYILPADRDPTYGTPGDNQWKIDFPEVRALPADAGSILAWNQAVLHWGAHASPRAPHPRISVAFEFQAGDVEPFNQPLMAPLTTPLFPARLKLIAQQILQYEHMYPLAPDVKATAGRILQG